ncbi:putative pre-mrna splicing factor protein [Botrytis fragariae]|uniref:Putative pre-mrna splicing factor protein n=1 Tax=Botrytis fragariae TaxID=1964551 RepID=A0A8H6B2J7_9HELO|nr:putative pre-mrna splicing factor protein [Botrytis fragariae]KAF5877955.1 putative pre-mrna splicing factor protein [Botrytis fragariae]
MAKRNSTQAAGSPAATEKKVDDVTMTNEKAGEAKGEVALSAKASQDENETRAPVDGEQATGSNKRKRDFKAEREAKRQRKEERNAPKKAAAVVREAEEAIAREKKIAEQAEAKKIREEEVARLREQKKEEKAKKHEENLRQQDEDKQRRVEEKKKQAEAKKRDAEEKRKDRERIQALEKQVRDLKRGHGNGKGKGAKRSWDKKAKGPKTSEFFGEGLKAQVIGDGDDEEVEEEVNEEVAEEAKEEIKKIKSKRSWKDLKKGNVAPTGLEAKIAAARASVAQAEDTLEGDVTMEDAPEVNGEQENKAEEEISEPAVGNSDVVAYPSLEHLIEDKAEDISESAAESDAPAQTEIDAEIPEETSDDKADEEQEDSEIPEEDSKETSPAAQEEDKAEDDSSKENAAPVADLDMEVGEPKEEVEASASAKKRSRKRVRNNNRLEAEDTPTKPATPASSKTQKFKTPTATPLSSKNQNVKTPTKSPAQTKVTVAKKGRPPVKAANKAQTAPKSPNVSGDSKSPKAKRGRVPKARAAEISKSQPLVEEPESTSGSQLLDISLSHHSCEIDDGTVDELGGTDITTGTNNDNDDDDVYESITCESPEHFNHESQTPSKTLQSFNDMELPILRKTESLNLNADESDSSELSDLSITDHPFLASDSSGFDTIEVDVPSLLRSGKKQRPPMHSPYFALPLSSTPYKSRKSIVLKGEFTEKNPSPKKESPKKRPPGIISCIPFPPLSAPHFGLIQEKLAHDPFRLLIAVTFLNRTHGKQAIPVFYTLMDQYPTPQSIVDAPKEDIVSVIRHLGLQNQRAATYQAYAKTFCENPPVKNKRYAVHDYPTKGLGRDVKKSEVLPEESVDPRTGWEIGHMTQGPYAIDSWRIFCRDMLLEKAKGWNGEGSEEEGFQPEWMRVLPEDKELRAFLRWMWLKEGFEWDPLTGEKEVAGREVMRAALEGRVAWDEGGGMRILDRVGEGGWRG